LTIQWSGLHRLNFKCPSFICPPTVRVNKWPPLLNTGFEARLPTQAQLLLATAQQQAPTANADLEAFRLVTLRGAKRFQFTRSVGHTMPTPMWILTPVQHLLCKRPF
jgi:hypothetical protein